MIWKGCSSRSISAIISSNSPLDHTGIGGAGFLDLFTELFNDSLGGFDSTSDIISVSSSSSRKSSSILVNELITRSTFCIIESLVFLMPSLIFSKSPCLFLLSDSGHVTAVPANSQTTAERFSAASSLETPLSCMVTPYRTSACSIVPRRWVIRINCVLSQILRR